MAKRSYHQFCPLAYSLDVIGERWTLLIVRELMFGPRRYTDLLSGLPGMGTNLLANRLKEMEAANILKQATLPPPAASKVYVLTERGQGLIPIIGALADWGMAYLTNPEEDAVGVVQVMGALYKLWPEKVPNDVSITCEFHAENEVFQANVEKGELQVGFGGTSAPDVVAEIDLKILLYLLQGEMSRTEAENMGKLKISSGKADALDRFVALYH